MTHISPAVMAEILKMSRPEVAGPKRGDAIFEGLDYPRTWDGFVGQAEAKERLIIAIASAKKRGVRIGHVLLASGIAGVGKTTLATLVAYVAGVGFLQTSGPLSADQFRELVLGMEDGDILFIDEIHRLVAGNKNRADWLLPFMTERRLLTDRGAEQLPDVTIVGATTDAGKMPTTLLSRFMVTPEIVPYTDEEGAQIAANLAERMHIDVLADAMTDIAKAADCNPRVMRKILEGIQDMSYVYTDTHPNLPKAFRWAGVSADGLSTTARDMLMLLLRAADNTASIDTLRAQLNEPGPIHHHEQQLLRRGFTTITGRGRKLTDSGVRRAMTEAQAQSA